MLSPVPGTLRQSPPLDTQGVLHLQKMLRLMSLIEMIGSSSWPLQSETMLLMVVRRIGLGEHIRSSVIFR